jgi:hypothetical protein
MNERSRYIAEIKKFLWLLSPYCEDGHDLMGLGEAISCLEHLDDSESQKSPSQTFDELDDIDTGNISLPYSVSISLSTPNMESDITVLDIGDEGIFAAEICRYGGDHYTSRLFTLPLSGEPSGDLRRWMVFAHEKLGAAQTVMRIERHGA